MRLSTHIGAGIILFFLLFVPHQAHAAIAFDALTQSTTGTSFSFTTSGTNRMLILFVLSTTATHCVATYNGVSMVWNNIAQFGASGSDWNQVLTLTAPASGLHTLTFGTCASAASTILSYNGVSQTGQPEVNVASSSILTTENHIQTTITVLSANSLVVSAFGNFGGTPTSYTGLTQRGASSGTGIDVGEAFSQTTGSHLYGANLTSANNPWSQLTLAFAPAPNTSPIFNPFQFWDGF